jgi:hypothetical protein
MHTGKWFKEYKLNNKYQYITFTYLLILLTYQTLSVGFLQGSINSVISNYIYLECGLQSLIFIIMMSSVSVNLFLEYLVVPQTLQHSCYCIQSLQCFLLSFLTNLRTLQFLDQLLHLCLILLAEILCSLALMA